MRKFLFVLLLQISPSVHAQTRDSLAIQDIPSLKFKISTPAFIFPAACLTYGILAQEWKPLKQVDHNIKEDITEDHPKFLTHADDLLQYAPAAGVYAGSVFGLKGKNSLADKTALYAVSSIYMAVAVNALKTYVHKMRPDGSDSNTFPSGHTATAFASAEFMAQEYKDRSPYFGIAAYTLATSTGTFRLLNNKHWLSDVITGAGIGVLSTKLAYATYPWIKRTFYGKRTKGLTLVPTYQYRSFGFSFSSRF